MNLDDDTYIDIDNLREDLKNNSLGAFYGGGFGAALIDSFDIDRASDEELIKIALRENVNLNNYICYSEDNSRNKK